MTDYKRYKLNVYDYALEKGVKLSVGIHGKEWVGRCPNPQCSSQHDAFSVQPEWKLTGRWAGHGAWMCRKCWDPAELVTVQYGPERGIQRKRGWGTIADLVMLCEGMTYREAEQYILARETGDGAPVAPGSSSGPLRWQEHSFSHQRLTDEQWLAKYTPYVEQARGTIPRGYLATRGLSLDTAKTLGFGYSMDVVKVNGEWRNIPFLVIPWYHADGTLMRCVNRRNLQVPLPDGEERYMVVGGSEKTHLYLGDSLLSQKRPTFLVESELDAATIWQEAGDLVHVVATGSVKHARTPLNVSRLCRQPFIFVAFDDDEEGEEAASFWLSKLDRDKSRRYRPLLHDPNDMHVHGVSVRQWVQFGLQYFDALSHPDEQQAIPLAREDGAAAAAADDPSQTQTQTQTQKPYWKARCPGDRGLDTLCSHPLCSNRAVYWTATDAYRGPVPFCPLHAAPMQKTRFCSGNFGMDWHSCERV